MGALTTATAVKLHLGITDSSEDTLLAQLILQASSDIESRCNRTLTRETRTAEEYVVDGDTFYLDLYPVVSFTSVTVDDVVVTDYECDLASGKMYRANGWGDEVAVTYLAGYLLEAVTGPPAVPRTLPYNLEYAAILWVASAYNSRGSEHLSDESVGPLKSVFWQEQPAIRAIVEKYRRINL